MSDIISFFLGYNALKVSIVMVFVVLLYMLLMYILWFFKRPSYKKLWGDNADVRRSAFAYIIGMMLGSYFDILVGFSEHREFYASALVLSGSIIYHLLVHGITYLMKKGSEYRKRIPNE